MSAAPGAATGLREGAPLRVLYRPKAALASSPAGKGGVGERPSGMAVEILEAIAGRIGRDLAWVALPPGADVGEALRSGKGDLVGDWGVTDAREREFLFTDPYLTMPVHLFVLRGADRPESPDRIAGLRIGVVERNISDELLSSRPDVVLVRHAGLYDALFALLSGKVDAVAHLAPVLWKEARVAGVDDRIAALEPPIAQSPRAFVLRRGDEALAARINKALAGFVVTPEYRRIHDKWFGKPGSWWTVERIVAVNAAALFALAAAMWFWRYVSLLRANARIARSEAARERALKYEEIATIAGGMAHNLNNQMMIICGYGEVIRKKTGDDDPRSDGIDAIVGAGRRAAELTGRLLAFSRHSTLFRKEVEVDALVRDLVPCFREQLGESVDLRVRPGGEGARVAVDRGVVEGAIREIVKNAGEAMPGGGRFTVSTGTVRVGEPSGGGRPVPPPGRYATLSFSDDGCGMERGMLERAFEPFRTTKEFGRGMGLPSAFGAVKQNGGFLDLESAPGAGTTATIFLPLAGEEGEARAGQ